MTIKQLNKLYRKGNYLILVERKYDTPKWFVGTLYGWNRSRVLAFEEPSYYKDYEPNLQIIYDREKITLIPPQDIVKYIGYLTEAGTEYLKSLKIS
jgi:hypothetical protein